MTHLYEPLTLRGVTLRNRIGVSPMCQYSSEDGFANDWHLVHLGSRAVGGAGLILTEAAAVEARGRISPQDLGIWRNEHMAFLQRITAFIRQQGGVSGIQLAHAGRKAGTYRPWAAQRGAVPESEGGWQPVAPSAIPFIEGYHTPHALSIAEIHEVQDAFAQAARRSVDAGFDVIELHGAHGYLMHEFLSPLSNKREDAYGGDFAGRTRFVIETVQKVRAIIPDSMPLLLRISGTDWVEGGWDVPQSVELARCLKDEGVDMIDCSSGGADPAQQIPVGAGYQVHIAQAVREHLPSAAVGLITDPLQADTIIRTGQADLVLMAREFLRNPYWALHAADPLHQQAPLPAQYERGF